MQLWPVFNGLRQPATVVLSSVITMSCFLPSLSNAAVVDLSMDFTRTDFQVKDRHRFSKLLREHYKGLPIATDNVESFNGVESQVILNGDAADHSIFMQASFSIETDTSIDFQIGADWGRGGGVAIRNDDLSEIVFSETYTNDIWWDNDWDNSDVITTEYDFTQGNWSVLWVGFESCCSGSTSIRFSVDDAVYNPLLASTFKASLSKPAAVPVSPSSLLFCSGVFALLTVRRAVS